MRFVLFLFAAISLVAQSLGPVPGGGGGGGGGTVTSVGALSPLFTTANPTTTPAFSLISQSQNVFLASPNGMAGVAAFRAIVAADVPTLNQSTSGNAATATALAASPTNCSAGSFPLGINASGTAQNCTALPTTITGTANQITASAATGAITLSIPSSPTLPGTTTGTFSGNLTGNVTGNTSGTAATITGALALANTPLTTRGDILVVNSTPALARLAKGTQYQTLQGGASDTLFDAVHLDQATAVTGVLPNASTTAASANTASAIVARDGSGNFSAGTITAALTGAASGNPPNARLINTTTPLGGGGDLSADRTLTCTTCVTSAAALTSTALVTGGGGQASQTPSATATMDSSGNISTPGTLTTGAGSGVAGSVDMKQGTSAAVPANSFGWGAPATMTTSVRLDSPNAVPAANQVMLFPAPTSNVSAWTWTSISGTGSFCMTTSCTMVTPTLGAATATSINKMAVTAPATSSTLAVADGKTFTASNTLTLTGTDSSSVALGAGGTVTYTIASGTSALGTGAISGNACATVVTTTATGTASTDTIIWAPNADISGVTGYGVASTDGLKVYPYPTTNNVNWRVCNGTGTSITPGAVTLNWRVVR